jgi:hypothetical protein
LAEMKNEIGPNFFDLFNLSRALPRGTNLIKIGPQPFHDPS